MAVVNKLFFKRGLNLLNSYFQLKRYGPILQAYGKAWEAGDIEAILDFFPQKFEYVDPAVPNGITNKEEMRLYLQKVYKKFPRHTWTDQAKVYVCPKPGKFAIFYNFEIAGSSKTLSGTGMERIEFEGNKLVMDCVHLCVRDIEFANLFGF